MARGVDSGTVGKINTQLGSTNQFNQNLATSNQAIQEGVLGGYENMIKNPGYDAPTKSAIVNSSEGAAGSAFGSAADQLARRAARANNSAGAVAGADQLARDKASTMSGIADKNQIAFADRAKQDVQTGLHGQAGIYGVDTSLLARTMGIPPELLATLTNATKSRPGFWETFGDAFGGSLGKTLGGGIGDRVSGVNIPGIPG